MDVPQQASTPTPLPVKKLKTENVGDQPVIVMVGGLVHGPAPNVIWLEGRRMLQCPHTAGPHRKSPCVCPLQFFHIQYGFTAEA